MLHKIVRVSFSVQQKLFTPGPLNTTKSVKKAMQIDYGSRDPTFLSKLDYIRAGILELANAPSQDYTAVILQGSGTYAIEATYQTCVNSNDKVLVVTNGSYGERQVDILKKAGKNFDHISFADNEMINSQAIIERLNSDPQISHVGMVHSETTSGMINCVNFLKNYGRPVQFIVDAMSSFGAYNLDVVENKIDYLISSSNKCIQGAPGFAFVVAQKNKLYKYKNNSPSLVLDLVDQDENMVKTNQFRFTPPTHVLVAFEQALKEHKQNGGIQGRFNQYQTNQNYLWDQMQQRGFKPYLSREAQGVIITTFCEPVHPNYNFKKFYDYLAIRNFVIYPGKKTKAPTFRIGSIGDLSLKDFNKLLKYIDGYLIENKIPLPVPY